LVYKKKKRKKQNKSKSKKYKKENFQDEGNTSDGAALIRPTRWLGIFRSPRLSLRISDLLSDFHSTFNCNQCFSPQWSPFSFIFFLSPATVFIPDRSAPAQPCRESYPPLSLPPSPSEHCCCRLPFLGKPRHRLHAGLRRRGL